MTYAIVAEGLVKWFGEGAARTTAVKDASFEMRFGKIFYVTCILENLEQFGALKAIGAKSRVLVTMILFQAGFTALTGYDLG
ncbi:hypothetical protein [Rudaea cellulosilytica]|uniref:hypothetical protein n=1 Tax=Rudaea cellulosilytica TaxID=540746 RepID=UPI0003733F67|nr:hypothetical protein [Rudaea cellulosilytica]